MIRRAVRAELETGADLLDSHTHHGSLFRIAGGRIRRGFEGINDAIAEINAKVENIISGIGVKLIVQGGLYANLYNAHTGLVPDRE